MDELLNEIKAKPTLPIIIKKRETLEKIRKEYESREEAELGNTNPKIQDWKNIKTGDALYSKSLKKSGVYISGHDKKNMIEFRIGNILTKVSTDDVILDQNIKKSEVKKEKIKIDVEEMTLQTIDVRGQSSDDAIMIIEKQLDLAMQSEVSEIIIVHGHGERNILKNNIRNYLKSSAYVESFMPGDRSQGGDGVTVVKIRE